MRRRQFLKIAGTSGVILAATGIGAGAFIATRSPTRAMAPWNQAGSLYQDPMRNALSYAVLAPNPHNRQPWMVELKSESEAVLRCDLERLLPATDPFDRQIVIGLGCFIELFSLAANHLGFRADVDVFPDGAPEDRLDQRPIAALRLTADTGTVPDPLFAFALNRRTNRNAYDLGRPVSDQHLSAIKKIAGPGVLVDGVNRGPLLEKLRELTRLAMRGEFNHPTAHQESVGLMRIGKAEIEASPDGIYLGGPLLEGLSLLGMISRDQLADPASDAFRFGLDMADEQSNTAMGFVWISTRGNARNAQLAAGRAYMRQALQVEASGLAMQPLSQALQEYAAMQPYYDEAHGLLTRGPDERVQMLARIGFADAVKPAPRWPLSTRIKTA
ncbi:MAG: hypothetical protein QNJ40_00455 [Xanthomonadales bacterium]|nr:hypothetical protein [Xanthomonadales bacterium]